MLRPATIYCHTHDSDQWSQLGWIHPGDAKFSGSGGYCPMCKNMLMIDDFAKVELINPIDARHTAIHASLYSRWSRKITTATEHDLSTLEHHKDWMRDNEGNERIDEPVMLNAGTSCRPIFTITAGSEHLAESFFAIPITKPMIISKLSHSITRISGIFDVTAGVEPVVTNHNEFNVELWWNSPIRRDIIPGDGALLFHGMTVRLRDFTLPPRL